MFLFTNETGVNCSAVYIGYFSPVSPLSLKCMNVLLNGVFFYLLTICLSEIDSSENSIVLNSAF
jgi:hypothetical protein